jgi:hypothetical protein
LEPKPDADRQRPILHGPGRDQTSSDRPHGSLPSAWSDQCCSPNCSPGRVALPLVRSICPPRISAVNRPPEQAGQLYGLARKLGLGLATRAANSSSDTSMPSASTRPDGTSRPLIAATQAPGLGNMTTGMPSISTSVEPGGRVLQSNMIDSNAGPAGSVVCPPSGRWRHLAVEDVLMFVSSECAHGFRLGGIGRKILVSPGEVR